MQIACVTIFMGDKQYFSTVVGENLTPQSVEKELFRRENSGEETEFNFYDRTSWACVIRDCQ